MRGGDSGSWKRPGREELKCFFLAKGRRCTSGPMSCCVGREGRFIGNGFTSGVPMRREYVLNWLGYGCGSVLVLEQISECAKISSEILLVWRLTACWCRQAIGTTGRITVPRGAWRQGSAPPGGGWKTVALATSAWW